MAGYKKCHGGASLFGFLTLILVLNVLNSFIPPVSAKTKVYIVYMGKEQHDDPDLVTQSHHEMLASVLGSKEAAVDSMIYSYRHGFSGFAATLTESQAEEFKGLPGVVHVMPNHAYSIKTTRSWDFLGLPYSTSTNNLLHKANMGDGIIVGVIDTGVWPESPQYNDEGLGPIPSRWKGKCVSGDKFDAKKHCNKKLIGAKWFANALLADYGKVLNSSQDYPEFISARDAHGHGTHTSTTAAGSIVRKASWKGLAAGVVRGGAPRARIAMYKPCWRPKPPVPDCTAADVLAAFEEAIHDGVDLLSVSLGDEVPLYAESDPRELVMPGAFHAVARGIPVICAAGNEGPYARTVANVAPWVVSVAATTMDRTFPTLLTLGNRKKILGQSMYTQKEIGFTSLMHIAEPENETIPNIPDRYLQLQENPSSNKTPSNGKVVLCFLKGNDQKTVALADFLMKQAGFVAVIVAKDTTNDSPPPRSDDFPVIVVDYEIGNQILLYIRSEKSPAIKISPAKTLVGKPVVSKVASFSSRGPNSVSPAILKPDIAAPGVNILASGSPHSTRYDRFTLKIGTSMACPHVAGIVALLKSLHPTWSPAAIRSAMFTTAWKTDPSGEPMFAEGSPKKLADPFDYGGGLVNPEKATDPGLVYDMGINDYIQYLCAQGYNDDSISLLVKHPFKCQKPKPSVLDTNIPAITIPNLKGTVTITRTVTNVGPVNSKYKALVENPFGVNVTIKPKILVFNANTTTLSFQIRVTTKRQLVNTGYSFGSLTWTDGVHNVASPISVRPKIVKFFAEDY